MPKLNETCGSAVWSWPTSWLKIVVTWGTVPAKLPVSSKSRNTSTLSMTEPAGKLIDTGTVCVPPEQTAASGPSVIDRGVAAPDEAQPAVCSLQFEVQVSVPPPRPRLSHVRPPRSVRSQSSSGVLITPSPQNGTPTQPAASNVQSG
jgi:hypothetical protein